MIWIPSCSLILNRRSQLKSINLLVLMQKTRFSKSRILTSILWLFASVHSAHFRFQDLETLMMSLYWQHVFSLPEALPSVLSKWWHFLVTMAYDWRKSNITQLQHILKRRLSNVNLPRNKRNKLFWSHCRGKLNRIVMRCLHKKS